MVGAMGEFMVTIQGQKVAPDVGLIEKLLADNPTWGRKYLSRRLCELWDWRGANGQLKDMACRTLLLRLERAGRIVLPPRQGASTNAVRNHAPRWVPHRTEPITAALKTLLPLQITLLDRDNRQFETVLVFIRIQRDQFFEINLFLIPQFTQALSPASCSAWPTR